MGDGGDSVSSSCKQSRHTGLSHSGSVGDHTIRERSRDDFQFVDIAPNVAIGMGSSEANETNIV